MCTPIPIIIPTSEPEKCPHCGNRLIREIHCKSCGKEIIEDDDPPVWQKIIAVLVVLTVGLWLVITLLGWLADGIPLFDVLKREWEWLKSIRLW